jgi:hypothetical protein
LIEFTAVSFLRSLSQAPSDTQENRNKERAITEHTRRAQVPTHNDLLLFSCV